MADPKPNSPLFVDRRTKADGSGFHALVIGVSEYQFLPVNNHSMGPPTYGLSSLEGPAASAFRIAQALESLADNLFPPLLTLRLLLSPCSHELNTVAGLRYSLERSEPATTQNMVRALLAWRADVERAGDRLSKTLFYFAGHGLGFTER